MHEASPVTCASGGHIPRHRLWVRAGLPALVALIVVSLGAWHLAADGAPGGTTRTYYIAAEEVTWDYAPTGRDLMMGGPLDTAEFDIANGPAVTARKFRKAIYREYTDSTFSTAKPRPPEWEHLGIMGPRAARARRAV